MGSGRDLTQRIATPLIVALRLGKERSDPDAENGGDLLQSAASDPVGSTLVLLNLLERDADFFAERCLRHSQAEPIGAHTSPHQRVNGFDALRHYARLRYIQRRRLAAVEH